MAKRLRLGVIGVGVAAEQVLPNIDKIGDKVQLTAVADLRKEALEEMAKRYPGIQTFLTAEGLCKSDNVDVVWVSTPNEYHAPHAVLAAENGKHIICEKPMAVSLAECERIVQAARKHKVKYVQGHSKIYYEPARKTREIIKSGVLGRVTQVNTWNFNDWIVRPFTANEMRTDLGAGLVFRQGPHQVDLVRYFVGSRAVSVRGVGGRWEKAFPGTESDFSALIVFEDNTPATLVFNGQGYWDTAELTWGYSEGGARMLNAESIYPHDRRTVSVTPEEKYEYQMKGDSMGRGPFNQDDKKAVRKHPFFGITVVSCERGVIRQSPDGIYVYDKDGRREIPCRGGFLRGAAELLELYDAIEENREPFLDAAWGKGTLEICAAIVESSKQKREIQLEHQAATQTLPGW